MRTELSEAFEECLRRIKEGEPVKTCLDDYPRLRHRLIPLLHTAFSIENAPRVLAPDEMRQLSKGRLMARLRESSVQAAKSLQANLYTNRMATTRKILERFFTGPAKVVVPITLALMVVVEGLFLFGFFDFISPSPTPALASECTLTTLSGSVELQNPGSSTWEEAKTGMTVRAGSWVRTTPDSNAVLTFFNGTTVKLEPGTVLFVEQAEGSQEDQPTNIVLTQRLGRTWSQVTKLVDPASHFEIQTPSATALVRGTRFVTDVDETGETSVETLEGLVSVSAEGKEVFLPAGSQTTVKPGGQPSEPAPVSTSTGGAETPGNQTPDQAAPVAPGTKIGGPPQAPDQALAVQGGSGLPTQDNGQGQAADAGDGQNSRKNNQYMWWMLGIATLFSCGAATFMWLRQ